MTLRHEGGGLLSGEPGIAFPRCGLDTDWRPDAFRDPFLLIYGLKVSDSGTAAVKG